MINYHKIAEELKGKIKGKISFEKGDLELHSKDASLFTVMPQMIIYPKDKFDVVAIVKLVNSLKLGGEEFKDLSLTARAAGTCMSGGSLNDSIILDMKCFDKIGAIDVEEPLKGPKNMGLTFLNKTIKCEPGVYFRDLEKVLDKKGLMYPSYPASKDLCCVGGIVSNNSSGEKTLLYGSTKDWVQEIEMVMSNGEIINFNKNSDYKNMLNFISENNEEIQKNKPKVSKNSSGYNLWDKNILKLIVGSQGTLGIITSVKLKLTERKKYSQMVTVFLPNLNSLTEVVEEVLMFKPEALESFDDHTFKIAIKFLPSIIWKMKGSIFQLAISFIPEVIMAFKGLFSGGLPKLILMAEFTGTTQQEANQKAQNCYKQIQKFPYKSRVTKNETDLSKYWVFRRESFNLLRSKLKGFRTAPFVEDIIVPIESMKEFIPQMQKVLDKYKFTYTIAGHAGNGNFHIIPLMKLNSQKEIEIIKKTNDEIFSLVQKYGGSISAEHNDGLVRTPYLHYMFSLKMLELFQDVKSIFDPLNIFNPNKKVGGSIVDNYTHIALAKKD